MNSSPFFKVQREHSFPLLPQQIPHRLLSHLCPYPVSCELPTKIFRIQKFFCIFCEIITESECILANPRGVR